MKTPSLSRSGTTVSSVLKSPPVGGATHAATFKANSRFSMNALIPRLLVPLCLVLTFALPSVRAASLSGESVTLTVTCSGVDSSSQPYNIVLHSSTFTVGSGVEVSGVAVSGAIPNPPFSPLPFSGTVTVDVGANTMSCRYQGTQGIGGCTFKLSSVADQSAGQISAPTLTSESGFQIGLNQSMAPSSENTGTGSVSANFFWAGIHSPVNQHELVTFTLVDASAPVLANLNGDIAAFTGTPVVIDATANMTITDSDAPSEGNIGGATVTISNFQAGDVLAATPASPVTASYSNGVLTLSGTSTRTIYRNALRSMTFTTSSGNTTTRSISTVVTDTTARSSTAAVSTVTVTGVVSAPVVTTAAQSAVTTTSATLGGNVTADGGASVTERGIVWNTSTGPTTANNKVSNGSGTGAFSGTVTGLPAGTPVFVRAYAINSVNTSYGSEISFTTLSTNAALAALTTTASGMTPVFGASTTAYTATVPNGTTSTTVTATRAQANATLEVRVNGGGFTALTSGAASSALNLNVGANPIDVKVTAQDGITVKTYTITVTRDAPPTNLSINDVSASEGNAGTTNFTFTVSLSTLAPAGGVSFDIATANGTATTANSDYVAKSLTTQTIPAGSDTYSFTVLVNGDALREANDIFFVNVTNITGVGAVITDGQGQGSITNDDFEADLAITVTDGATTEVPGTGITYTITASNAGPDPVTGATVSNTFPGSLSGVAWTAVGAGGGTVSAAGSGNISENVNLPAGASVTFTVNSTISPAATGNLSNTATISSSAGTTDTVPGNNSATDTDTLTPQADLSITKTNGTTTSTPGGSTTYTIVVSNAGPSNVTGATVSDTLPSSLTATWTAVGAGGGTVNAAGSGNINETVNLPVGGSVTFTVSTSISPAATGSLSNTATVTSSVTDPTPGNNSATDTDTLTPSADLSITKTDGVTTATPGGSVTYTITASNAGPSNATSINVADTLAANIIGATWTGIGAGGGTGPASGSGNINATNISLPAGASFTFTVNAPISPSATGTLINTANVSSVVTDPVPGNNSATDTDTFAPQADLSVTLTNGVTTSTPGGTTTYTLTVSNSGPSAAPGTTVTDSFPSALAGVTWTAVGAGGGTATASGSGDISDTANLPVGGSVTYTITGTVSSAAFGTLSNTATVATGSGVTDGTPGNNSATDTDNLSTVVSITATDADADENTAATGTWRVLRNGTSGALTVNLAIDSSSTAAAADWTQTAATFGSLAPNSTGTVVIPDGVDFVDINLVPSADIHAEAAETVRLNVTADAAYAVISPSDATVTIGQNDFVVINTNDSGEGTLRQAVLNANDIAGDDTITFDATAFATAQTITLTSGQLAISSNTIVQGTGAKLLTLNGNAASRIFNINNNAVAGLSDLTATNGTHTTSWGGAINVVGGSNVTLERCVVSNSTSQTQGGGIYVSNATLNIRSSTISGNTATTIGGGAIATGNSVISATVNVTNSTISGNIGPAGGAMLFGSNAVASLNHTTVTNNTTTGSGAAVDAAGGAITVANSLIAGNVDSSTKPDATGAFTSSGGNVIGNAGTATGFTATNDLTGTGASPVSPQLATLADNGGPTLTHALLNGSPAINNGLVANLPKDDYDQRGNPNLRTRGPAPDSGAVEAFAFEPTLTAANTDEDTLSASGLVITANPADGGLTTHYRITGILNGTLYQNDGATAIPEGGFITKAQGLSGLRFLPGANLHDGNTTLFGFSAQAAVSAAVGDLRGVAQSTFITVNSINDAPTVVAPGLSDQTMGIGGNLTITLPDKFTDLDGDLLGFSVLSNSKGSIASATVNGTNLKLAALDNGVTTITLQASDGLGGTVSDTFTVQVGTSAVTATQPFKHKIKVNRGNGLFEISVLIANTTPLPLNGFRMHVDFSKYLKKHPSLRLVNADSPGKKRNVYVDYRKPIAVDGTAVIKLQFHTKDRKFPKVFKPIYTIESLKPIAKATGLIASLATTQPDAAAKWLQTGDSRPLSAPAQVASPQAFVLPDGSVQALFPVIKGRWYRVSYSTDRTRWINCPKLVQATGFNLYWTDSGPPETASHPAGEPTRFYRLHDITTP